MGGLERGSLWKEGLGGNDLSLQSSQIFYLGRALHWRVALQVSFYTLRPELSRGRAAAMRSERRRVSLICRLYKPFFFSLFCLRTTRLYQTHIRSLPSQEEEHPTMSHRNH